jgi:glucokinase
VIAPTYDALICGRGLALLHQFFNAERRSPAEVAEQLTPESEVARLFSRFYARAARNYALAVLPREGIYISGGVAAKNPFLVDNDIFRREFTASKHHQSLLQRVPLRLNRNEESGVWGAAHHAMQLLHPSKA